MKASEREEILKNCENELHALQNEFAKFRPSTDWNELSVKQLLQHLNLLIGALHAVPDDVFNSTSEYFKKNIEGLKLVLESERGHSNDRSVVRRS